ncbi:HlyD family secretion protein [Alteromonas lipotrueiana]|uniref:HlyD family secretion protein n=1 Tax=Alteromonas lipotrueiana TaxID=2803815 RepID=UPI001C468C3F|nr:HlyD family efflux transporter periplasmic adaptor subunit [Alteromonas lipotrueiana]
MRNGLFRPQALAAQGPRLHGSVFIQPSIKLGLIATAIVVWSATAVIYLSNAQYSRQATVRGWLEPPTGIIKVYPDQSGSTIKAVLVKEGQQVSRGDVLVAMSLHHSLSDGRVAQQSLEFEYQQQLRELTQQIAQTKALFERNKKSIQQNITALTADEQRMLQLCRLAQTQLSLAEAQYLRLEPLKGTHIAAREVDTAYARQLSAQQAQGDKQQALAAITYSITQQQQALQTLPLEQKNALSALNQRRSEIRQQLVTLQSQSQRVLRASRSGVVSNVMATVGHSPSPDKPLLTLEPLDQHVRARFAIPVSAAGFVQQGQQLAIRYDAYPYQKFGLHQAVITTLSSAAMLPGDIEAGAAPLQEPVYMAEATLDEQQLNAYGSSVALKSGMTFTADISLGERSLLEWLLEPLLSLSGRVTA